MLLKKIFYIIFLILFITPPLLYSDLNCDKHVSVLDAIVALQVSSGMKIQLPSNCCDLIQEHIVYNKYKKALLYTDWHTTFVGFNSGFNLEDIESYDGRHKYNTYVGSYSGTRKISALSNTCVGAYSGYHDDDENDSFGTMRNTFIGYKAGLGNTGDDNVFIGENAGASVEGNYNIFIGPRSGLITAHGFIEKNICIGPRSGIITSYGDASGNILIGYRAGNNLSGIISNRLSIQGNNNSPPLIYGQFDNQKVGINTISVTRTLTVNGDAGGSSAWYSDSDERLKTGIKNIVNPLDKVIKLKGVKFKWKNKEKYPNGYQLGLIAQDVLDVVPEVVDKKGEYYSIQYSPIIALLIEAIKELNKKNVALEHKINNLLAEK